MATLADLELTLRRASADAYAVELRYTPPDGDADVRLTRGGPFLARFDLARLLELALDPVAYGKFLGQGLFADANLQSAFTQARANAQTLQAPLRVRLFIDSTAGELHTLRWELLRDPGDDSCLATGERILFSRYLASSDWRRVTRRAKSDLRALAVIANPSDLAAFGLAPVDVAGELQRVTQALGNLRVTALASEGKANLNQIFQELRSGYDVFYLVCHGMLKDGVSRLWLEAADGKKDLVEGRALVERMNELDQPPRLVILASCQSAQMANGASPFIALGPQLAESGVAAIVAMQGNVSMQTMAQFMPAFFAELQRDGQIDRALAVARGTVRERDDAWMPALFMRLKSGALWYVPGFAGEQNLEQWPSLVDYIHQNLDLPDQISCIPILGSGLLDPLFGSTREIARRWADAFGFPLAPHAREDLPQVAQYLAVKQGRQYPRTQLMTYLRGELLRRFDTTIPAELRQAPLEQLIACVGKALGEREPNEPHQILAQLPFPIYITTNPDHLLAEALIAAGRQPQVETCPWDDQGAAQTSVLDNRDYRPDVEHPLVYHLFGHFKQPRSIILTEDEYFDYLIGVTNNKSRIPTIVRAALADSLLLFLGFQIDDWNFRVLLRSIMTRGGSARLGDYAHVAVQIDPEESRTTNPQGARNYLKQYFQNDHINVFWGNTQDFMNELVPQWNRRRQQDLINAGPTAPSTTMEQGKWLLRDVTRKEPHES